MNLLGTQSELDEDAAAKLHNRLPFRISLATRADMDAVARLRTASYGRHLPELGERLAQSEPADFEAGCEVLVATSKLDGSLLGTLRIHSNVLKPLPLEASVDLPLPYVGSRMAEATRLCIKSSTASSLVRSALFKAFYFYCADQQIDWMLAVGRRPVDRLYDALLFSDVGEPGRYLPMAHVGNLPHRAMSLATASVEPSWMRAGHPLYGFFFLNEHVDIDLSGAKSLEDLERSKRLAMPMAPAAHPHLTLAANNGLHYPFLSVPMPTAAAA